MIYDIYIYIIIRYSLDFSSMYDKHSICMIYFDCAISCVFLHLFNGLVADTLFFFWGGTKFTMESRCCPNKCGGLHMPSNQPGGTTHEIR